MQEGEENRQALASRANLPPKSDGRYERTIVKRHLFAYSPASQIAVFLFLISTNANAQDVFIPEFANASAKARLTFTHNAGSLEKDYIIEANGSGVALFDYDNDEDLDIYLVNGSWLELPPGKEQPVDKLFRNDGDWKFTDVTKQAGLGSPRWGCACGVADVDNDGDRDLYVANWGPNQLYINNGDGTFTEVGKEAGVDNDCWAGSCAFGDYDGDGYVDLYVSNYLEFDVETIPKRGDPGGTVTEGDIPVHCGPGGLTPTPDILYHNNGDGTFTDVSEKSGIRNVRTAYGLGVLFIDGDRDDLPDIYVANDYLSNFLFKNKGDGTFEDIAVEAGVSYDGMGRPQHGMGVDAGDLTGDNQEDILVLNYDKEPCTLYENEGDGFFIDISKEAGLYFDTYDRVSWGCVLLDAEYDGDLDIFIANGHVWPQIDQTNYTLSYRQQNQLFLNNGTGRFRNVTDDAGDVFEIKSCSRGCAYGDLDNDGDLDVIVNELDAPPTIYENLGGSGNHWLGVNLTGTSCNRDAIGSWVTVRTSEKEISRYLRSGCGYASHSEMVLRFGLGKCPEVKGITVRWPDGTEEQFACPGIDRIVHLVQGR